MRVLGSTKDRQCSFGRIRKLHQSDVHDSVFELEPSETNEHHGRCLGYNITKVPSYVVEFDDGDLAVVSEPDLCLSVSQQVKNAAQSGNFPATKDGS